ncbi:hypothetical protein AB0F46_41410 [Streptomyces sp. NPDC026665]|uniref:hypothetical protein n=1 Tax=Streptomyces sp. NPDC026665 TaxID=3154798 RepID=UPI0033D44608
MVDGWGWTGQVQKREQRPTRHPVHSLQAQTLTLLALAFAGFGLRLSCDGLVLAAVTQMLVRLPHDLTLGALSAD